MYISQITDIMNRIDTKDTLFLLGKRIKVDTTHYSLESYETAKETIVETYTKFAQFGDVKCWVFTALELTVLLMRKQLCNVSELDSKMINISITLSDEQISLCIPMVSEHYYHEAQKVFTAKLNDYEAKGYSFFDCYRYAMLEGVLEEG